MMRTSVFLASAVLLGLVGALLMFHLMGSFASVRGSSMSTMPKGPESRSALQMQYPNCRFGASGSVVGFDVAALNLGWYVDWTTRVSPIEPPGVEYVQMVRLVQRGESGWDFGSGAVLTDAVQANPGATWLVGNEPDSPYQDDMIPQAYARAYHDVYEMIKALDPAAQVGIGGIVQPTPLRFAYLDSVWDTYHQVYGEAMPVDFWNIHSFILRETVDAPDPEPCGSQTIPVWGAYIPPGSLAQSGELYCIRDQDSLAIFEQRIIDFRRWMASKGERNKPLIVTEYGVLFPEDYWDEDGNQLSSERVSAYMLGTFDFFLTYSDPALGYPADNNRLVQRWAWFSIDGDPLRWGGSLFDNASHALQPLGQDFRDYAQSVSPEIDLLVTAEATPGVHSYHGSPITATLRGTVSNAGNVPVTSVVTITFYSGTLGVRSAQIGDPQVITTGLPGCAGQTTLEVVWPGLDFGAHPFYVEVTANGITEPSVNNNVAEGTVLVTNIQTFLPLVMRFALQ